MMMTRSMRLNQVRFFSSSTKCLNKKKSIKIEENDNTDSKRKKLDLSNEKKFSKFIREFNRNNQLHENQPVQSINEEVQITDHHQNSAIANELSQSISNNLNNHTFNDGYINQNTYYTTVNTTKSMMMKLPKVPSTSHLDLRKFRQDIFYQGYRPLLLPIKNDFKSLKFDKSGANFRSVDNSSSVIPNIWNNSALGTEHYKEMDNIPYRILVKLRPFQRPPDPNEEFKVDDKKKNNWKGYFSKRGVKN